MKLKTSNKLLLGYVAGLLVLIGGFLIFGFTNLKNLPKSRFSENAEISSEAMDEFSVLHISGEASLRLDKGDAFEIIRTTYPKDSLAVDIAYSIRNDTCFVTRWDRRGMNHAVLRVRNMETVIVENRNKLSIDNFAQDRLKVSLIGGQLETGHKLFEVNQLELTASEEANARLQGINNLHLNIENSELQVYSYLESISGELTKGSRLQLQKSVGKLNLEKSRDSSLFLY